MQHSSHERDSSVRTELAVKAVTPHREQDSRRTCSVCHYVPYSGHCTNEHTLRIKTAHHRCTTCSKTFGTEQDLLTHLESVGESHNTCAACNRHFVSWRALEQHWLQSRRHSYCQRCREHFAHARALDAHYDAEHVKVMCKPCGRFFTTAHGLAQHLLQASRHVVVSPHRCPECDGRFASRANLEAHLGSGAHNLRSTRCVYEDRGCTARFVSEPDMVAHLESGVCPSGVTQMRVRRFVVRKDRGYRVTVRPDVDYSEEEEEEGGRDGEGVYICRDTCKRRFTTLSALYRHARSRECTSLRRIERMVRKLGGMKVKDRSGGHGTE
ncbi:hypothetical protein PLICRDRAFT_36540 [Plicaturopsis crispa FD-325 SS-3]|nr:hypothetical protein PLICRDRAFT_36540 [Plicaturopsis crispa FD-325 SS-3]